MENKKMSAQGGSASSVKKRIFSGIQPSGNLHIGNYLGAIKNWVGLQDEYDSIFCVVDLHAITVPQDPEELRKRTIEIAKIYLAAGIDPEKSALFIQSQVSEHTELAWILNTIAKNGDLTKMTQFKSKALVDFEEFENVLNELQDPEKFKYINEKSEELIKDGKLDEVKVGKLVGSSVFQIVHHFFKDFKEKFNSVGVSLFDYPVLMAADILLYDTEVVPVGEDQVQHIELARTLARRFNKKFGDTFIVPKAHIKEEGMRIMGLDDPTKKMSKSATSPNNYISLLDSEDDVRKKIKKAVTDSGTEIVYTEDKPALRNLINIYSSFSDKSPEEIVAMYKGKGYADFKSDLADVVVGFLNEFRKKFNDISDEEVLDILNKGAEMVRPLAQNKSREVKDKMGIIQ